MSFLSWFSLFFQRICGGEGHNGLLHRGGRADAVVAHFLAAERREALGDGVAVLRLQLVEQGELIDACRLDAKSIAVETTTM